MRAKSPMGSQRFTKEGRARLARLVSERPDLRKSLAREVSQLAREAKKGDKTLAGLYRQHVAKLMEFEGRIGVISPEQEGSTEAERRQAKARFLADLKRLGYRKASPLQGRWGGLPEGSFLIENIRPEDLFELGRKYRQPFVVYKPKDGILGVYHLEGDPRADVVMFYQGDPILQGQADGTEFSKARGLNLAYGYLWGDEIPWDGLRPVLRRDIKRMLRRRDLEQD